MPLVPPAHETMPHPLTATTPFSNFLLDSVMPTLKDTEWRLLCVIVRQTMGWRAGRGNQRKAADWLSHHQLKTRTGRSSAALCQAIDVLVHRHLIEVRAANQELLLTPQARRGYGGKLYFRLGPAVLSPLLGAEAMSNPEGPQRQNRPKAKRRFIESEIHKAKTTKETLTKYLSYDKAVHANDAVLTQTTFSTDNLTPNPLRQPVNPQVQQFLHAYSSLFKQHNLRGEPPVIAWGKDGKIAKELLNLYSYERLLHLLEQFFSSPNTWQKKQGYSLSAFRAAINGLLVAEGNSGTAGSDLKPRLRTGHWSKAVPVAQNHAKGNTVTQQL